MKSRFQNAAVALLIAVLCATAFAPIAHASELVQRDIEITPDTTEPVLDPWIGFWLAEVHPDYVDVHLWYKFVSQEVFEDFIAATSIGGVTYTYDNNGNLTSDST